MALIKEGLINNFSVEKASALPMGPPSLSDVKTFAELAEVARKTPQDAFRLMESKETRGVGIKSIQLTESFEGFIGNVFNPTNDLYFVALAYDLSGEPVFQYPGKDVDPQSVRIPIKVGKVREFIGEGIDLFPKRNVVGGIALRIQIWESDQSTRDFGKVMGDIADRVAGSQLTNVLSLISLATGVSGATIELVEKASVELMKVIGGILQANSDDFVDFFEGYYAADQDWILGKDTYTGNSSIITLDKY